MKSTQQSIHPEFSIESTEAELARTTDKKRTQKLEKRLRWLKWSVAVLSCGKS